MVGWYHFPMAFALAHLEEGLLQQSVRRSLALDCLTVAVISGLSAATYLPHLGFYSDDWSLLQGFSDRQAFLASLAAGFAARPVQGLYLDLLYLCFGFRPLGYHIVNTTVLGAGALLFYLLLLRLRLGQSGSFATTLLFIMLPQLSTVRVWFAAFQIPLSMLLMFISLHCQLSYARSRRAPALVAAAAAGLLSVGAYEIFAPLLVGFAAALSFAVWRTRPSDQRHRSLALIAAGVLGVAGIALVLACKVLLSGRAGPVTDVHRYMLGLRQLFRTDYDWRTDSGLNIFAMASTYFRSPARGVVDGFRALATGEAGLETFAIAILIAVLCGLRLYAHGRAERMPTARLLQLGIAALLLGNATFLVVPSIVFTSTGMDNRVQVADALGVAMIFAAIMGIAAGLAPVRYRQATFAAVVVIVVACAFARITAIERYWAEAPALQRDILGAARADLRQLPANSTVILDGVCPYHGPAVVFETYWDTSAALTMALGRPVSADVVSSRMRVTGRGLETSIYNDPSDYPYGNHLYVYDAGRRIIVQLRDADAAMTYFRHRPQKYCPGLVARGVEV